jgi:hypothetical protein
MSDQLPNLRTVKPPNEDSVVQYHDELPTVQPLYTTEKQGPLGYDIHLCR